MYKIVRRQQLNDTVVRLDVEAPFIAAKAKAGQFIIFRIDEQGERVPLTIADTDPDKGTVTIIFQIVGQSTMLLSQMKEGDYILDFVGLSYPVLAGFCSDPFCRLSDLVFDLDSYPDSGLLRCS